MATIHFATTVKTSVLTAIRDAIDAGGAQGKIKVYSGAMAATTADAPAGTLLGTLTLPYPCTSAPGSLTAGVLTMGTITQDASADANGTATWARITTSADVAVMDIDITATGGGGTLTFNTTNIVALGPILVSSFVINVA